METFGANVGCRTTVRTEGGGSSMGLESIGLVSLKSAVTHRWSGKPALKDSHLFHPVVLAI